MIFATLVDVLAMLDERVANRLLRVNQAIAPAHRFWRPALHAARHKQGVGVIKENRERIQRLLAFRAATAVEHDGPPNFRGVCA